MCAEFAFGVLKFLLKSDTAMKWLQERQRPLYTALSACFDYSNIALQIIQALIFRQGIQS